eukprot:scaffold10560_cov133-Isochrysis_galbana.AAC.20
MLFGKRRPQNHCLKAFSRGRRTRLLASHNTSRSMYRNSGYSERMICSSRSTSMESVASRKTAERSNIRLASSSD